MKTMESYSNKIIWKESFRERFTSMLWNKNLQTIVLRSFRGEGLFIVLVLFIFWIFNISNGLTNKPFSSFLIPAVTLIFFLAFMQCLLFFNTLTVEILEKQFVYGGVVISSSDISEVRWLEEKSNELRFLKLVIVTKRYSAFVLTPPNSINREAVEKLLQVRSKN